MDFERGKYPELPGVYLMKGKGGETLYIGKATDLRARLSQHFSGKNGQAISSFIGDVEEVEFIVTRDAAEALILESNLIKANQPRFNMLLKSAKHYSYLAITGEEFPRLLVARKNSRGNFRIKAAKFYGPFVEGTKRAISASYLRRLFKIRICAPKLPKKVCLQFHMGNCDAPCIGRINKGDYGANVEALGKVLEGKGGARGIIGGLESRMRGASETQDYETAKTLRDQIEALEIFFGKQRVEQKKVKDEDFIFIQRIGDVLHARVLKSRSGVIRYTEKHDIAVKRQEEPELAFFAQYYEKGEEIPYRVYSNLGEKGMLSLNEALQTDAFQPARGDKKGVLEMASESVRQAEVEQSVLRLQTALGLAQPPLVIETFDISTLFGENSVGSMVRFVNGKPDKGNYRKYGIRGVEGQDDFAMMKEVVGRRYLRLMKEGARMPDLVLIDGGPGQLHSARDALEELGLQLNLASIAKREEELYVLDKMEPIRLPRSDAGLKLVQFCRDEAHRFAIGFHRQRRGKLEQRKTF